MSSISNICFYLRKKLARLSKNPILSIIPPAVVLTVVLESLGRHAFFGGFLFMLSDPLMFLYNVLIIMFTLSLSLLFSKRAFVLFLIILMWLMLGIANYILLFFATIPLGFTDILLIRNVLSILDMYLSPLEIGLVCTALVLAIIGVIFIWKKCPRRKVQFWRGTLGFCSLAAVLLILSASASGANAISYSFGNLVEAYDELGFAYCFTTTVVDRGVGRPDDYSEEAVSKLCSQFGKNYTVPKRPNVIFVQLESFFDPALYADSELSENPIPVFTDLRENCSGGFLTVPVAGTGTANTEFEILTGMSIKDFGPGEYPYKTVLKDFACESLCYSLSELGYSPTVIHNNTRTFYGRDEVFANLGFKRYVSIEDMENVTYNPTGWANDDVLTGEILNAVDRSIGRDFIYAITVQAHGKYTDIDMEDSAADPEQSEEENSWEYYAEQLSGTDAFIGALIDALEQRGEPTVVVLFGDHLPSLGIEEDNLACDLFETEYLIWSNIGLEKETRNLCAYQLGAYVQERLGLCSGTLTALHQLYDYDTENTEYGESLELLEYDILYGDMFVYGGLNPFEKTALEH